MSEAKEIIRLREGGSTYREITAIVRCSQSTVSETLKATKEKKIAYAELADKDDETVYQLLFGPKTRDCDYYLPDWAAISEKLGEKGVNLSLAWDEYIRECEQSGLKGYQYSQFCNLYNTWEKQHGKPSGLTRRIKHNPARILEVDWSLSVLTEKLHYQYI